MRHISTLTRLVFLISFLTQTKASSRKQKKGLEGNMSLDDHHASNNEQAKTVLMFSKKILKKMQTQNELNNENLSECYQNLGKYTRLMILNKNFITKRSDSDSFNKNTNFKFQASFILQKELDFYLLVIFPTSYIKLIQEQNRTRFFWNYF